MLRELRRGTQRHVALNGKMPFAIWVIWQFLFVDVDGLGLRQKALSKVLNKTLRGLKIFLKTPNRSKVLKQIRNCHIAINSKRQRCNHIVS